MLAKMEKAERRNVFKDTMFRIYNGEYPDAAGHSFRFSSLSAMEVQQEYDTKVVVVDSDSFAAAGQLVNQGFNPLVLNMASSRYPGGGVVNGAAAQEESLSRRSNLVTALYPFAGCEDVAGEYCTDPKNFEKLPYTWPLNGSAFIYTPKVTVFKDTEENGCKILDNPFVCSVITISAVKNPMLNEAGNFRNEADVVTLKNKIRTILRCGILHKHDSLVLGAFGCGVYKCPPEVVSKMFLETLKEDEFRAAFKMVMFAVLDDKNGAGNFAIFSKNLNNVELLEKRGKS